MMMRPSRSFSQPRVSHRRRQLTGISPGKSHGQGPWVSWRRHRLDDKLAKLCSWQDTEGCQMPLSSPLQFFGTRPHVTASSATPVHAYLTCLLLADLTSLCSMC